MKSPKACDNPEQSKRFIGMAREVGVDESPRAFDQAFESLRIKNAATEDKRHGKSRMGKGHHRRKT